MSNVTGHLLILNAGLAVACRVLNPEPVILPRSSAMEMIIGTDTFQLELADSEAAAHFRSMLPLTVKMMELNGNEKYVDLPKDLPTTAARVGTIEAGDLMLWGKNTLVLFYKTFRSEYAYTRIGKLPDADKLGSSLGTSDIRVQFSK